MYKLLSATIELTRKCNAQCKHCIVDAGKEKQSELTDDEILQLIDDLDDLGCTRIVFTGGEAFLRENWELFLKKTKNLDMKTAILSNGLLVDKNKLEILKNLRCPLGLSLDGPDAETHDVIRGVSGLFDKVINAINLAEKIGVSVSVATTVMQSNFNKLDAIYDLLIDTNIYCWQLQVVKPASRLNQDEILTETQYYQLAEKIAQFREQSKDKKVTVTEADCIGYYSKLTPKLYLQTWEGCSCGIHNVSIESDGNVKGCPNMNNSEGNIKDRSFKEIWMDKNNFSYNRNIAKVNLDGYCKFCKYKTICRGGCPTNAKTPISNSAYCLYKIEQVDAD